MFGIIWIRCIHLFSREELSNKNNHGDWLHQKVLLKLKARRVASPDWVTLAELWAVREAGGGKMVCGLGWTGHHNQIILYFSRFQGGNNTVNCHTNWLICGGGAISQVTYICITYTSATLHYLHRIIIFIINFFQCQLLPRNRTLII